MGWSHSCAHGCDIPDVGRTASDIHGLWSLSCTRGSDILEVGVTVMDQVVEVNGQVKK